MIYRLSVPDHWAADALQGVLGEPLSTEPARSVEVTYLDTFDWRIHDNGSRLTLESEGRRRTLHWASTLHDRAYVLPVDGDVRFVRDLPDGFLRTELEPIVEVRALLSLGSTRVVRRPARLLDPDGDTTVHLWFESAVPWVKWCPS